jgi:hypothetical protein
MRRPQFSLKTLLWIYAIGLLVAGIAIVLMGAWQSALSSTSADVLAERISPTMDQAEVRRATFDFLESRNLRLRIVLVIAGIAVALVSIPLFVKAAS